MIAVSVIHSLHPLILICNIPSFILYLCMHITFCMIYYACDFYHLLLDIIVDIICARSFHGFLFPNVYDCTSYYQCVYGRAVKMHCQSDLRFNPETKSCDWPSNVECWQITKTTKAILTTLASTTKSPTFPQTTNATSTAIPTGIMWLFSF
jgi:hypothetical protein